jgi:hypothetical protein
MAVVSVSRRDGAGEDHGGTGHNGVGRGIKGVSFEEYVGKGRAARDALGGDRPVIPATDFGNVPDCHAEGVHE